MNQRIRELAEQAKSFANEAYPGSFAKYDPNWFEFYNKKFAESMVVEFCDVVKTTANELNEHYFKQGASEEEVLMRVNGALVVLGHIRARFVD